jgi:hypothetical protein
MSRKNQSLPTVNLGANPNPRRINNTPKWFDNLAKPPVNADVDVNTAVSVSTIGTNNVASVETTTAPTQGVPWTSKSASQMSRNQRNKRNRAINLYIQEKHTTQMNARYKQEVAWRNAKMAAKGYSSDTVSESTSPGASDYEDDFEAEQETLHRRSARRKRRKVQVASRAAIVTNKSDNNDPPSSIVVDMSDDVNE